MRGVITFTIKVITLTIKVITPFMPVSYLFHKLKSGHPNLYLSIYIYIYSLFKTLAPNPPKCL